MARGLLCRILDYMLEQGWIQRGSVILDTFGGVSTTAIEGASRGLKVVTVELEERFHRLGLESVALHKRAWQAFGDPQPLILQGDSRHLCEVLRGAGVASGIVGSPPWQGSLNDGGKHDELQAYPGWSRNADGSNRMAKSVGENYGDNPANLGGMPAGQPPEVGQADCVGAIVGSPPFVQSTGGKDSGIYGAQKGTNDYKEERSAGGTLGLGASYMAGDQGDTAGQLGSMKEGTPPGEAGAGVDVCGEGAEAIMSYLDSQRNPSTILTCEPTLVKTAECLLVEKPSAANHAAGLMSQPLSKAGQSLPATGQRSLLPDITSQPRSVGANHTLTGKEAVLPGEVLPGESSADKSLPATITSASSAVGGNGSKSTTSRTRKRRAGSGTTASTTCKPCVPDVTSEAIGVLNSASPAPSVERSSTAADITAAVPSNVGESRNGEPASASTTRKPKPTPANSASSRSNFSDTVTNSALPNASEPAETPGCEPTKAEQEPENFWSAARDILRQCYLVLKPGGVCAWVCKDFIRSGQRVPFAQQWATLCAACGLEPFLWVQASLVKEERHPSLFGGDEVKKTERKSFFRRLSERRGSPKIDHEDVIFCRKKE